MTIENLLVHIVQMSEAQNRYRASEKGKLKHRGHMREYMTEWRKRRKESADYNAEVERRKWREQHQKVREKRWNGLAASSVPTADAAILRFWKSITSMVVVEKH